MNEWQILTFMIDTFIQTKNEARVVKHKIDRNILIIAGLVLSSILISLLGMLKVGVLLKFAIVYLPVFFLIMFIVKRFFVAKEFKVSLEIYKKLLKDDFVRIHEYHTYSKKTEWSEFEKEIMKQKLQLADPNI